MNITQADIDMYRKLLEPNLQPEQDQILFLSPTVFDLVIDKIKDDPFFDRIRPMLRKNEFVPDGKAFLVKAPKPEWKPLEFEQVTEERPKPKINLFRRILQQIKRRSRWFQKQGMRS